MRKLIFILALIPTMAWAQEYPGCTPRADTPQAILNYFQSYNTPLPESWCVIEGAPQEQPAEEVPQEQAVVPEEQPPESQYSDVQPAPEGPVYQDTPPAGNPAYDVPYEQPDRAELRFTGRVDIDTPWFSLHMNLPQHRNRNRR